MNGLYPKINPLILFEHDKWVECTFTAGLKTYLNDIWQNYSNFLLNEAEEAEGNQLHQPFLTFDGQYIKARNYIGFIQYEGNVIEIYPKVFSNDYGTENKEQILQHIFYWLSYSEKWKLPYNKSDLANLHFESFPELLTYLIAANMHSVISAQPFQRFEIQHESISTPRGSIDFSKYISSSLSKGKYHIIECITDPLVFDNKLNRILKYCARLLSSRTKNAQNFELLQDVIFMLDEVEDTICSTRDIDVLKFNSFYEDYLFLLNSCRTILDQQLYSSKSFEMTQWCLLLPMEQIFEGFLAGFIKEKYSSEWNVGYQKSDMYLSNNPKAFRMKHDIYLRHKEFLKEDILIDTKYKLRGTDYKSDIKKGIVQSDIYQVLSYAIKRGINNAFLIYPNQTAVVAEHDQFVIAIGYSENKEITITAMEVPFWSERGIKILAEQLESVLNTIM